MKEGSEEKIFLLEPSYTKFKTRVKCDWKVSFGIIKVAYDGTISYVEKVKHNSQIDVVVDPFGQLEARFFLFVFLPERFKKGKIVCGK